MNPSHPRRIQKESFRFPSRDGRTSLHGISWVPEGEIRGLVQICHGLNNYIGRYDAFARFLAAEGFLVFGHDYLGHGQSAAYDEDLGYFGPLRGDDYVLADILMLSRTLKASYPELPLFLIGDAAGTYFVRRYLFTWPEDADGAVLIAPAGIRLQEAVFRKILLAITSFFHKERYRPRRIGRQSKDYMKQRWAAHRSPYAWLSPNEQKADPYRDFVPTLKLYRDLNHSLGILAREEKLIDMPEHCPVLILYGAEDPLSRGGEEPKRLAILYKQAGLDYVSLRGYSESPAELSAEDKRGAPAEDILLWLESALLLGKH